MIRFLNQSKSMYYSNGLTPIHGFLYILALKIDFCGHYFRWQQGAGALRNTHKIVTQCQYGWAPKNSGCQCTLPYSMRSANDGVNIHLCIFGMQKKHFTASNFTSDKISSCAYTLRKQHGKIMFPESTFRLQSTYLTK